MKRFLTAAALLLLTAAAAFAQQPQQDPVVAVVNGETITAKQLDALYGRMPVQMRAQYDQNGGKAAFLDNYIRKRLVVQEAIKSHFDQRPDVQQDMEAARESALFDKYIRDVVAGQIVTDSDMLRYYEAHKQEYGTPEAVKVRHIIIQFNGAGPKLKTKEEAQALINKLALDLADSIKNEKDAASAGKVLLARFELLAKQYSEDQSAQKGGDLGWMTRGSLDPTFEQAAFALKPMSLSPPVETRFGYHLIFVEDHKNGGLMTFNEAKPTIREKLLQEHAAEIMSAVSKLTNELRVTGKVSVNQEALQQ